MNTSQVTAQEIALRLAKLQDLPQDVRYQLEDLAERILCQVHLAEQIAFEDGQRNAHHWQATRSH